MRLLILSLTQSSFLRKTIKGKTEALGLSRWWKLKFCRQKPGGEMTARKRKYVESMELCHGLAGDTFTLLGVEDTVLLTINDMDAIC